MGIRSWQVSHSLDGFSVRLVEVPIWAMAVSGGFDHLCGATRHVLCGNGPGVIHEIPLGKPQRDEEGYLTNSLGMGLYKLASKILFLEHQHEVVLHSLAVDDEVGKVLWGEGWEDDEDDDQA